MTNALHRIVWMAVAAMTVSGPALSQSVEQFYKGNTITILIAGTPGGGFDAYSRLLAQHMPRFLPGNPNIVAKNMAGAGGLTLANHLYNVAAKDGTVIAYVGPMAMQPLFNPDSAQTKFDPTRFTWIGSMASSQSLLIEWHTGPIKTADDLFTTEMIVNGTGAASNTDYYPKVMNQVLGTKFKLITGYVGSRETLKAIEQGEAHGRFMSWDSVKATSKGWVEEKKIRIIMQAAQQRHPELADIPTVLEVAEAQGKKDAIPTLRFLLASDKMGRPIAAPPGLPADRVAALREAFAKMVVDQQYLDSARKQQLEPDLPLDGAGVEETVKEIYKTPKEIVDRVAAVMK
jgi:tripartite-type tricarboxylate transporter receptor subunit TctC